MSRRGPISHYNTLHEVPKDDGTAQAIKNQFARNLEAKRIALGISQSELARRASEYLPEPRKGQKQGKKIGRDQISHYSRGISLPRPETLAALAKALRCTPQELMPAGVPSTSAPQYRITALPDGKAVLTVNQTLSAETALKILAMIRAEETGK